MKNLTLLLLLIFAIAENASAVTDSLTRKQFIRLQTIKSDTLNQMALQLAVPGASSKDLNEAIELIIKGLHTYSRFRDTAGLVATFDNLSLVYRLQKKLIQAKWFAIQSNMLSRERKDTANVIRSLLTIASVKTEVKDFDLAKRDLNEALQLAKLSPQIDRQIDVQKGLAAYYTKKGDAKKAELALNRIIFLKDSVTKHDENVRLTALKLQTAQQQAARQQELNKKQAMLQKQEYQVKKLIEQKNGITIITVSVITLITLLLFTRYLKRKRRKRRPRKL